MDDAGFYDGWTGHTITITPSFSGINLRISGPNRNDIKDYLYETFDYALSRDVTYYRFLSQFPEFAVLYVSGQEPDGVVTGLATKRITTFK